MRADILKALMGESLVGKKIHTEAIGDYPGGVATVVDLGHDPNAPEIVMNVDLPGFGETIGVFEHENVSLYMPPQVASAFAVQREAVRIFRKRGRPN